MISTEVIHQISSLRDSNKIDPNIICLMPWIHMHIWPSGSVYPCCMSDSSIEFGNVKQNTINEVINNDSFKELRLNMLDGVKPKACMRCYELETSADSWTLRRNSLMEFKQFLPLLASTNDDGTIDDFKMRYLDIRFSNLCNMKCRTCGPSLSSSWFDDQIKLYPNTTGPKLIGLDSISDFMKNLMPHLDSIEEVYFAGGEALITPQHYEVLDYWIKKNRLDVRLRYTTNFSSLTFKDRKILDLWEKFRNVRVAASLDTFGEKAEYSRKGTRWDNIIANRKEMIEKCPNVYFEITPTISVFSVHSLYEFHKTWVEEDLLSIDNIRINILTHPRYFSITMLPMEMKKKIEKMFGEYLSWLQSLGAKPSTLQAVRGVVDYMYSADHQELIPEFLNQVKMIDRIRNENFYGIYPEYAELE